MTTLVPFNLLLAQVTGEAIDFDDDALAFALVTAGTGAPNVTSIGVRYLADLLVTHPECTGTGYTRQAIAGASVAVLSETAQFSFANVTFPSNPAGVADARYAVAFKDTGNDATSVVFAICDLGDTISLQARALVLAAPVGGLLSWRKG